MNFEKFNLLVSQIKQGKHLPESIYLHVSAFSEMPSELVDLISKVTIGLKISRKKWNILKLSKRDYKLSLLSYPKFDSYPYPELQHSWTIDLAKLSLREADYKRSENPPILHRRETFLVPSDPKKHFYQEFTNEGENIGLYENTRIIGTRNGWHRLIKKKGYCLTEEGRLQPLEISGEQNSNYLGSQKIQRHLTALSRDKLSVPMFLIAQRGYLDGSFSVLDYGCGRGDDLRELEEHGVPCVGWDPVHLPETDIEPCDIVNLGYVLNVIEDVDERRQTLERAFSYTSKFLVVSVMLGNERVFERYKPYKDGVITSRNTFQKYYFQGEFKNYLESILATNAIAIAPGIFAVFKDQVEEQRYLVERQRTRHAWRQISVRPAKKIGRRQIKSLFEKNKSLLEDFWYTCLDLGRVPTFEEFELTGPLRQTVGSFVRAFEICSGHFGEEDFVRAQIERKNDLLVYFALGYFNRKRDAFSRMPRSLQVDIKAFFRNYSEARKAAKGLLFSVSDVDVIYDACVKAHDMLPASELNGQHDLIFHKDYLHRCPIELRVYVGCATQLYGDLDNVSLIKAHILSGKVSLMVYDNWSKDVPLLTERIKIKMREQDIDFFDYIGDFEPQPLPNKVAYVQ